MHRRTVLLGTTALLTAASGCATLSAPARTLDLTVFNQTDSPYTVSLSVFRTGGDATRSEARVYSTQFDLTANGRADREDVAPERPAVVRYEAYRDDSEQTDEGHVHYYPTDDGDDGITFDVAPGGALTRR